MNNKTITIAERLAITNGRPSGFDYMRLLLAFAVIILHSVLISYGSEASEAQNPYLKMLESFSRLIVPMFFVLSGFLVAGSLERSKTLISFLGLRVFRIIPALILEVLLCTLILGPFFTNLPLSEYFSDPKFYKYFLNMAALIQHELPGVFENNPFPHYINGQLWTVPYELFCYVVLSVMALCFLLSRERRLLAVIALYQLTLGAITYFHPQEQVIAVPGQVVILCFLCGLLFYRCRDKIKWSTSLFWISFLISVTLLSIPNGAYFVALPAAYMTVYLGLLNPVRNKFLSSGDYSYGTYLYGFPIQQSLVAASPFFMNWYWNALAALPLALALGVFSWWTVEKPALHLRKMLKYIEAWYMNLPIAQKTRFLFLSDHLIPHNHAGSAKTPEAREIVA